MRPIRTEQFRLGRIAARGRPAAPATGAARGGRARSSLRQIAWRADAACALCGRVVRSLADAALVYDRGDTPADRVAHARCLAGASHPAPDGRPADLPVGVPPVIRAD